jgi:tRNA A-37 threonylcarbamoyl transferase component Bud32
MVPGDIAHPPVSGLSIRFVVGDHMQAGMRLSQRYVLESLLGSGGMGEVWRARDEELGRPVAVKVLRAEYTDPELAERFRREARIAGRLQHPGITVVHDVGSEGGRMFMVMELLHGRDLQAVLNHAPAGLPAGEAASLVAQAAAALQAAHAERVVHRDLKPANLFLLTSGQLKICDFGIARALDASTALTAADQVIGTASYMSPEQCTGRQVDQRSDLYSLGCVLYALLAGGPPFRAGTLPEVIAQHINADPPPLSAIHPDVPAEVDRIVSELLAKDPAARPDAGQVAAALQAAVTNPPGAAPMATAGPPAPSHTQPPWAPLSTQPPGTQEGIAPARAAAPPSASRRSRRGGAPARRHAVPAPARRARPRARWALAAAVPVMAGAAAFGVYLSSGAASSTQGQGPTASPPQSQQAPGPSTTTTTPTPTTTIPLSASSVVIDTPAPGASVQGCAVFSGHAALPPDYTLVLSMRNTANPGMVLYLEAVSNWDKPADLAQWTGFQYFGSNDSSVGQTYEVSAVIMPAATVRTLLADPANRPTWHVTALPQGSIVKQTLRVSRVSGPGPAACQ